MTDEDRALLITIAADTKANKESLGVLFRTIEGNGRPGLKQEMAVLQSEHVECKRLRELKANQQPQRQGNLIQWLMVATMVATAAITIIVR